ncbi:hypothetical protein ACWCRC_32770 [Streptomyces sp. NPDC001940]|uniref:hypothetical protein n=1 Tax=Streptomyces sp. NPDC056105 TaxID=3345714 RepID=UPI0035D5580F
MSNRTNRPESEADRALRQHSEAVREERTQLANDERIAQGLTPKHCGVEVSTNRWGDWECVKCGADF